MDDKTKFRVVKRFGEIPGNDNAMIVENGFYKVKILYTGANGYKADYKNGRISWRDIQIETWLKDIEVKLKYMASWIYVHVDADTIHPSRTGGLIRDIKNATRSAKSLQIILKEYLPCCDINDEY